MCIICRMGVSTPDHPDQAHNEFKAELFLASFMRARNAMKEAADAMKQCAEVDRGYDATHKRMVQMIREWNRLEEFREVGHE